MTITTSPEHASRTTGATAAPGILHSFVDDPELTVVTGLVDAVSILRLGRVFVANMTGNVVFLGFAVARAPGFSLVASLVALVGFMVGAVVGGHLARRGAAAAHLLATAAFVETVLVAAALVVVGVVGLPAPLATTSAVAGLLALAMGVQNAVARHLAVPDLTTTVLTMALTGFAADPRSRPRGRRAASVVAMFGGAVVGAALVTHGQAWVALGVATGALLAVSVLAVRMSHTEPHTS
jgi:uncharacterized membrane protein YoaK (UPF0700 family)